LIQLGHFLFLEVFDFLLSFSQLVVDSFLSDFHAFTLLFQLVDVETNLFFAVVKLQTLVTKFFDFINFEVFLTQTSDSRVIFVFLLFLRLFFLFLFTFFFVVILIFFFDLLSLSTFFCDAFVELSEFVVLG